MPFSGIRGGSDNSDRRVTFEGHISHKPVCSSRTNDKHSQHQALPARGPWQVQTRRQARAPCVLPRWHTEAWKGEDGGIGLQELPGGCLFACLSVCLSVLCRGKGMIRCSTNDQFVAPTVWEAGGSLEPRSSSPSWPNRVRHQ